MGHTSNGLHRISHLPSLISGTPEWVKWPQDTSKSSQIGGHGGIPGSAIRPFHLCLFHLLSRLHHTIFLHSDLCTGPSWGVTIVCFVHTCHRDCSVILRATQQRICGALCWQHAYMDGMCARLGYFVVVLDWHQKRK